MRRDRGFSLVEVSAALALVVTVVLSVGTALLAGRTMAGRERDEAIGRAAAQARLATLTALAFGTVAAADGSPFAVTDTTTDVAADPPGPGGTGLRASPLDALWADRPGYVDYLDAAGAPIGSAAAAARAPAAYVRRWSIGRQGSGTGEVATIAVLVAPTAAAARAAGRDPRLLAGEAGVVVRRAALVRQAS